MQHLGDDGKITDAPLVGLLWFSVAEAWPQLQFLATEFILASLRQDQCRLLNDPTLLVCRLRPAHNDDDFAALSGVTGKAEIVVSSYWRLVKHSSTAYRQSYP